MSFPITIIDNFFNDPNYYEKYGQSLDYFSSSNNTYPGKRSKCLSKLDPVLYNYINYKILSLFYSNLDNLSFRCDLQFQLIENNNFTGFVHEDPSLYTFIIYLTPDSKINCGTSFYKSINNNLNIKYSSFFKPYEELKYNTIKNNVINEEEILQKQQIEDKFYTKTLDVKDIYNRLLIFPGHIPHSANYFLSKFTPNRLTLIGFVYDLSTSITPLHRSNTFYL